MKHHFQKNTKTKVNARDIIWPSVCGKDREGVVRDFRWMREVTDTYLFDSTPFIQQHRGFLETSGHLGHVHGSFGPNHLEGHIGSGNDPEYCGHCAIPQCHFQRFMRGNHTALWYITDHNGISARSFWTFSGLGLFFLERGRPKGQGKNLRDGSSAVHSGHLAGRLLSTTATGPLAVGRLGEGVGFSKSSHNNQ